VRYADEYDIPFIVRAGSHGGTQALSQAKNAIQIDFRALNGIKLSEGGQTATIGGSSTANDTINTLAKMGKQTGELLSPV
jgi:FAD/FMN-containing dehydrogenase